MSFKDHFSGHADAYAANRPPYLPALVEFLASLVPAAAVAWDAGCGSGQLSVLLADRFERVIATDASAEQIARAAPHPRVEYRRSHAETSGVASGVVDLAVAAQAVHWFDLHRYYDEVRRVARPDGVIALVAYGLMTIAPEVDREIFRFYSQVLEPFWPPERRHIEDRYRSLEFPFEEIEAPALEISVRWTLRGLIGYLDTWSAVRSLERAVGREPLDTFYRDLTRVWGSSEQEQTVQWPLILRVGRL